MKIEMKSIVAVLVIMIVCVCVFGFFAFIDDVNAQSVNQREWLLEYEQVVDPYPAPPTTDVDPYPTADVDPYPAPPVEPTPTKKPKTSVITSEPTKTEDKDQECITKATDEWWRAMRKRQAYFYAASDGTTIYCFGYPPTPFYEGTPDPPREGDIIPTSVPTMDVDPYPAPPTDAPPYPAP